MVRVFSMCRTDKKIGPETEINFSFQMIYRLNKTHLRIKRERYAFLHFSVTCHNVIDHSFKYKSVKGPHAVPVHAASQSEWPERSGLVQGVVNNLELQPGFTRQFHFGVK